MIITSDTRPQLVEKYIKFATQRYNVNIDVVKVKNGYDYDQVEIPAGKFDYSGVVDALIQHKYPIDKMQAVINNYLLEPENEEYVTAFHEMQAWRKEAKEIAKEALLYDINSTEEI